MNDSKKPSPEHGASEHAVRVQKVTAMHERGTEPWPAARPVPNTCQQVLKEFTDKTEGAVYTLAGRIVAMRGHGKTAFWVIQDVSGRLQLYLRKDELGEEAFQHLMHDFDLGDIVWARGITFRTRMGEVTLQVQEIQLLSKCLHPLPEKFHGLTDTEIRYRQRYLDLISNPESREKFKKRSLIVRAMRNYLDDHGFLEVETPMLHPIPGGATARPFVTHHNAFDDEFFLRVSPELYLKRLVIGGFDRVYEINRSFRNEGVSTKHNPEFTMAEFYMAHHNYHDAMDFVETMLRAIVEKTCDGMQLPFGDHTIDFAKPFVRMTIKEAVITYGEFTEKQIAPEKIDGVLKKLNVTLANSKASHGEKLFALFEEVAEDKLIQPTFITEFPIEVSPLAKRSVDNPAFADRFELFITGMEIANAFNELNEPFDQAERFHKQVEAHKAGDIEAHRYDADYVHALEYGLPPTVGVGIGIDRLTMVLTNTTSIRDVILFPTLKKKDIE